MDLPRCIYPPNKCFVYHEKISELLFRDQPVLKELALENELITITESDPSTAAVAKPPQGLNNIQRNVIREWLQRPVRSDHGVYRAATDYLSDSMPRQRPNDCCYYSESEVTAYQLQQSGIPRGLAIGWGKLSSGFASATESRRRSDDVGFETSNMNAKRKRKSYGSVTSSATGGSSVSRRQRRDDSDELLKPLMETNNGDDDTQELIALDDDVDGKDNLGFVRDCLSNTNSVMTTYQL
jgi:hypothetical protein